MLPERPDTVGGSHTSAGGVFAALRTVRSTKTAADLRERKLSVVGFIMVS